MKTNLVLASNSQSRKALLNGAGLQFRAEPAQIDERAVEEAIAPSENAPDLVARRLAEAKAVDVSARNSGSFVIGSDQTLSLGDTIFHKPATMDEAAAHIRAFSGRTHHLNCGVAIARDGKILWSTTVVARMTMRPISEPFLQTYLKQAGEGILASVGAYQFEGAGVQLFEKIEGDFFTILGLPMLQLLQALRDQGAIDG